MKKLLILTAISAFIMVSCSPIALGQDQSDIQEQVDQITEEANRDQNEGQPVDHDPTTARYRNGDACQNYKAEAQPNSQRYEYCAAAEQSDKAAKANGMMWKVYAGVTAICGAYCAVNTTCVSGGVAACGAVGPLNLACSGTNIAATVADVIQTKDLAASGAGLIGAVTSLTGLGTGLTQSGIGISKDAAFQAGSEAGVLSEGTTAKNIDGFELTKGKDAAAIDAQSNQSTGQKIMACVPFLTAAVTTFMKKDSEKKEKKAAEENRAKAGELRSIASTARANAEVAKPGFSKSGFGTAGGGGGAGDQAGLSTEDAVCRDAADTQSGELALQCAVASGNISPNILSPRFQKTFEDFTGQSFGDFVENAQTPSQAVGSGLAQLAGAGQALDVAQALDQFALENQVLIASAQSSEGVYSGGGGTRTRRAAQGNQKDKFAKLLGKLLPGGKKGKKKKSPFGVNSIAYRIGRIPASEIERATEISLFDRVTYRYMKSNKKVRRKRWVVPYNRVAHGLQ